MRRISIGLLRMAFVALKREAVLVMMGLRVTAFRAQGSAFCACRAR